MNFPNIKRTLLIDTLWLLYRSFHGYKTRFTSEEGVVSFHSYMSGFGDVYKLAAKLGVDQIVFTWDDLEGNWRQKEFEGYKEGRSVVKFDFDLISEFVSMLGAKSLMAKNFEGDDVIAHYIKKRPRTSREQIFIFGKDRDFYQLLSGTLPQPSELDVQVFMVDGVNNPLRTADTTFKEYGVTTDKFNLFRSLVGDTSDKIPGIFGCPKLLASSIVMACSSLDEIYDILLNPDSVDSKYAHYSNPAVQYRKGLSRIPIKLYNEIKSSVDTVKEGERLMDLTMHLDKMEILETDHVFDRTKVHEYLMGKGLYFMFSAIDSYEMTRYGNLN